MISLHEHVDFLFGYLHSMWRYRWSALLLAWIVTGAGAVYVLSLPDTYQARATVNIDNDSVIQPLLAGLSVGSDRINDVNIMARILLSRNNLLDVIRETDMGHSVEAATDREKMILKLRKNISVENISAHKDETIYQISYESPSPELAFEVVYSLLNKLIESTLNSGRVDTANAEKFLDGQISEYEKRLSAAEERLAAFKKKNAGYMPGEKGGYYERLNHLQDMIEDTRSKLRVARSQDADLRKQLSGESPLLESGSLASSTASKLRNYQEKLKDMLTQYTDEYPDVIALRARIADLQAGIDPDNNTAGKMDEDNKLNPVYQDLKAQESRARVLVGSLQVQLSEQQAKLEELKKAVNVIPEVEAELEKLNRDYGVTKERYLKLVERRESARMTQQAQQDNGKLDFRVVDAPVVPVLPTGPNRLLGLAICLGAGLAAGLGMSVLRILLFPVFVDYKQVHRALGLPVLGIVSLQVTPRKRRQRRIDLSVFILATGIMVASFGILIFYQHQFGHHIRAALAAVGV